MIITNIRKYSDKSTHGELYINGNLFCYTLEDKMQPYGIKTPGETCIGEGTYCVSSSKSTRFKKHMLLLSNHGTHQLKSNGVIFEGIRPHGGNDVQDTSGCPLVGFDRDIDRNEIWNSASDELYAIVKFALADEKVYWTSTSIK